MGCNTPRRSAERDIRTTGLTLTRAISAKAAAVFDRWLDAKKPGSPWFGAKKAIVNPVVDGLFYHAVHFEGHDWAHYGRFIALERGQPIEHSWVSEAMGRRHRDGWGFCRDALGQALGTPERRATEAYGTFFSRAFKALWSGILIPHRESCWINGLAPGVARILGRIA